LTFFTKLTKTELDLKIFSEGVIFKCQKRRRKQRKESNWWV